MIFSINYNFKKIVKSALYNFPQPMLMSSNVYFFFFSGQQSKPKDIDFTIKYDKEKAQILTFAKLEPAYVLHFSLKMTKLIFRLSK